MGLETISHFAIANVLRGFVRYRRAQLQIPDQRGISPMDLPSDSYRAHDNIDS